MLVILIGDVRIRFIIFLRFKISGIVEIPNLFILLS